MRIKNVVLFLCFLIFGFSQGNCQSKRKNAYVHTNHLGITLGQDKLEKLDEIYGQGYILNHGEDRCYFYPKKKEFVIFTMIEDYLLAGITISKNEELYSACKSTVLNKELIVEGNIRLGDTLIDIKNKLGTPTKQRIDRERKTEVLEYNTNYMEDSSVRLFFDSKYVFRKGLLIKIQIYNGK